jgi:hypothetical protein
MQWAKVASDSDNHDIAMVHNVGAKLRLNHMNRVVNVSKDMELVFGWVKPFRVQCYPIQMDWGALDRQPILFGCTLQSPTCPCGLSQIVNKI